MKRLRIALLYWTGRLNATLSYQHGWPGQFARDRRFDVWPVNLARRLDRSTFRLRARHLNRIDAIIMLHSVFSNERVAGPELVEILARTRTPKAFFVGNEYKLMPEKVAFAEAVGVDLVVSQLASPAAHDLYRQHLGCEVVGIPNTGVDPTVFTPQQTRAQRPIELGFRAHPAPLYLGHDEHRELATIVGRAATRRGLKTDISIDEADRFDERGWAAFLGRCRGQIGSEAGADHFELTDRTRLDVEEYLAGHPHATLGEVRQKFFEGRPPGVSGRALSGRIVEAAATMTCQILLEGEYGGYFQPDVHYIPLRKDFLDVEEALDRLADASESEKLVAAAYEVVAAELTYHALLTRFREALATLVS